MRTNRTAPRTFGKGDMENPFLIIGIFLTVAILIAIPLSKVISRGMLGSWRLLMEAYPGRKIEWEDKRRFTSAMIIGGNLPLRFNNMLQLSATSDSLGLSMSFFGPPNVVISMSDVAAYSDQTIWFFTKVEVTLKKSDISLLFWGRGGRFVKKWLSQQPYRHG